jgi:hypothetical protein
MNHRVRSASVSLVAGFRTSIRLRPRPPTRSPVACLPHAAAYGRRVLNLSTVPMGPEKRRTGATAEPRHIVRLSLAPLDLPPAGTVRAAALLTPTTGQVSRYIGADDNGPVVQRPRYARTASTLRLSSSQGGRSSLSKIDALCFAMARSLTTSCSAIAAFDRPSAM